MTSLPSHHFHASWMMPMPNRFGFDSRGFDWVPRLAIRAIFRVVTVESDGTSPTPQIPAPRPTSLIGAD